MLISINETKTEQAAVPFRDAAFPVPFTPGLEYNSPAHGTWNIVHMGMLVPASHQIYVCAPNCARGVVLTAAEMDAMDRMSTISLCEEDFFNGEMEELIIEGVSEIIGNLRWKPAVILLFTVCVHHFMGTDLTYIYDALRERFPEYRFVDCYMDPIMQKGGLTPDQKLRMGMYQCLEELPKNEKVLNIVGNDHPIIKESEILTHLREQGFVIRDITTCDSFEEYLKMGEASYNLVSYPLARPGGTLLSERLGMEYIYLPQIYDYDILDQMEDALWQMTGVPGLPTEQLRDRCEGAVIHLKDKIGDMPIAIDATVTPYVLSLAKYLLLHGFAVRRIYADAFLPEEEDAFAWIRQEYPEVLIYPTIDVRMRTREPITEEYLAVGQKAAYFTGTKHFVNMVEGGGLLGYEGILAMLDRIEEAFDKEKDTRDLVVRKGLGCVSCI